MSGEGVFPKNEDGSVKFAPKELTLLDTWKAMENLVNKGLVRSIGLSNFNSRQTQQILDNCSIKPVVNQVECHPYLNQNKLIQFSKEREIFITAYSPLGSPDRPWAGSVLETLPNLLEDKTIGGIAKKHEKTPAQIMLRWQIQRGVIIIPKSVTPARIEENFALFDFELSADDMAAIASMDCNGRFIVPQSDGKLMFDMHHNYPFHDEF